MTAKTITLTGAEIRAGYSGGSNAWLRNDGADVIYAAAVPGITAGSDGVVSIPAGQSAPVYGAYGTVYLLGTGSVQLIGSDYSTNPFKTSAQSGGSGADSVARAAITAHAGNTEIHVTAAEKSGWDGLSNPNLLINPDFKINQRGKTEYTGVGNVLFAVDAWRVGFTADIQKSLKVNADGSVSIGDGANRQYLFQSIENPSRLVGDYTVSFSITEISGSAVIQFVESFEDAESTVASSKTITEPGVYTVTKTLGGTASAIRVQIRTEAGTTLTTEWAKLELGSVATPFVPPDPAAELLRCQRYFTIYKHQNATSITDKCTIGVGYALTSSIVYAVLPIAAMRGGVAATVSYNGLSLISGADTVVDYTSVTALEQTDSTVQVAFTVSGQTPGSVYRLRLMNSNAYLAVSKEL